jgi:hypothetical protein
MNQEATSQVIEHEEHAHHHKEKWLPTSHLTRAEREEMKALSKEVFGSSSRWAKFVDKGVTQKVTKKVSEEVTKEDGTKETVEKVVPVHLRVGHHNHEYSVHKYFTVSEVKAMMLERKAQLEQIREQIAQQQAEAKQKQEEAAKTQAAYQQAKTVQKAAGGSAI